MQGFINPITYSIKNKPNQCNIILIYYRKMAKRDEEM